MSKPRILAIGAAVQDVFLTGKVLAGHKERGKTFEEFAFGSKNEVEGIYFSTGGGATNAAVTFARQGLRSAYMGRLGHDTSAVAVLEDLHKEGVNTELVSHTDKVHTGYSLLLLAPNGERTILTYRGASVDFNFGTHDFQQAHPDWFYVSSLSGDFKSLEAIVSYASKHDIKVAINPGKDELKQASKFKKLIPHITILSVNKEEAQMLFRGETCEELARHAVNHIPIVMVTDGPRGSVSSDGKNVYTAGMYDDVPVVDRTGAGDAFTSGFVAALAAGKQMEEAITLASANSTSVVSKVGAKAGILTANLPLHKMPIVIEPNQS